MIIFFEFGRTGNQLFQYIGLKKYFPNDKLLFFGCKSLYQYFDKTDIYFLNKDKTMRWFLFVLPRIILYLLADLRILGSIRENDKLDKFRIIVKKGIFSKLYVAREIYFQHKDIIKQIEYLPSLKKNLQKKVLEWFQEKKINPNINTLVFVHIRRKDYSNWPSKDYPALLDFDWYSKAIELIKKKINNPVFIIMGDDQSYIQQYFKESQTTFISKNNLDVDLSIMSMCSSGIMSASSFSWWGAYYARLNNKDNCIFIGPNFWGGYKMKKWFPPNFKVDWITYLN